MTIVQRFCPNGHGAYDRSLGRCPQCPAVRAAGPARAAQHAFRQALLAVSDGRCAYTDANGNRCSTTTGLQAAHATAYSLDGNYASGCLLCPTHHRAVDR
jgi:hypothetical protein